MVFFLFFVLATETPASACLPAFPPCPCIPRLGLAPPPHASFTLVVCLNGCVFGCVWLAVQSHVERYFRDIAQVTDVVVMEVAVSVALAWDLVGCTPFDFLSQLCGLVPPEAAQGLFGIPDAHTLGRVLLKESVGLARLAASGVYVVGLLCSSFPFGHFFLRVRLLPLLVGALSTTPQPTLHSPPTHPVLWIHVLTTSLCPAFPLGPRFSWSFFRPHRPSTFCSFSFFWPHRN